MSPLSCLHLSTSILRWAHTHMHADTALALSLFSLLFTAHGLSEFSTQIHTSESALSQERRSCPWAAPITDQFIHLSVERASLVAETAKHLPAMTETWVPSLGWKIPWRRKWQSIPVLLLGKSHGWRSLIGSQRVGHDWATSLKHPIFAHSCKYCRISRERKEEGSWHSLSAYMYILDIYIK